MGQADRRREAKQELQRMREVGVKKVETLTCQDERVCPQCKALDGKIMQIATALKNLPVPNQCSGDCRCIYLAVFK